MTNIGYRLPHTWIGLDKMNVLMLMYFMFIFEVYFWNTNISTCNQDSVCQSEVIDRFFSDYSRRPSITVLFVSPTQRICTYADWFTVIFNVYLMSCKASVHLARTSSCTYIWLATVSVGISQTVLTCASNLFIIIIITTTTLLPWQALCCFVFVPGQLY